jgi:hypothetical protein
MSPQLATVATMLLVAVFVHDEHGFRGRIYQWSISGKPAPGWTGVREQKDVSGPGIQQGVKRVFRRRRESPTSGSNTPDQDSSPQKNVSPNRDSGEQKQQSLPKPAPKAKGQNNH